MSLLYISLPLSAAVQKLNVMSCLHACRCTTIYGPHSMQEYNSVPLSSNWTLLEKEKDRHTRDQAPYSIFCFNPRITTSSKQALDKQYSEACKYSYWRKQCRTQKAFPAAVWFVNLTLHPRVAGLGWAVATLEILQKDKLWMAFVLPLAYRIEPPKWINGMITHWSIKDA